jgi:single-strand DNA-binding protein
MSQTNYITLSGYVTAEPKLVKTSTGIPRARIRVGSTPRRLDRQTGEWSDGETSYYNVICWRKLADNVANCLRKGDMILVRGRIQTRTWVDDQQRTRVEIEIDADSVGHDMSFGWSHFNRGVHVSPSVARSLAQGEAVRQDMGPDPDLPEETDFLGGPDDYGDYGSMPGDDGPSDESTFADLTRDLGQPDGEPAQL